MMKSSIMKPTINLVPLKVPLSLWDNLPTEIINEINDYNKLPYLDELSQKRTVYTFPGPLPFALYGCDFRTLPHIEARVRRHSHTSLWGDTWLKNEYGIESMYVARPERHLVIKLMKKNNLRVRKGMKTRTMLTQLIKL